MGIARSTFYDEPTAAHDDTAIVEAIAAVCDEFEFYGWRRVRAELRHRGMIVNHKKVRRLMREHDLQPRRRRRYVATTDSDHDQPIYPNRAKDLTIDGPNQLWVADITYVAIVEGFAYVAVILDAWSRRAASSTPRSRASFAVECRPKRIIFVSPNRARSAAKSATNTRSQSAVSTTANCTTTAMKPHGGRRSGLKCRPDVRRTRHSELGLFPGRRLAKRTPVPPPFSAMNNMPAASDGDRSFSTVDLNLGLFQIYLPS